ncbi:hypothetical protein E2562_026042 [Oryza meyeriana var. granulata]|uniref:Retroviral polymerase SH3-like domain-containing protein n=1 Tax=Oryza meyeriana var. granulata TaxID=110450 RepID=A0A6G1EPJ5_9ORYZ|nr:hypothetical protein E2562_026042 [Oryza meyeriana var. granulata]
MSQSPSKTVLSAYRFYDPATERVHVSRDAIFDESARWEWADASTDLEQEPFTVEQEYELPRRVSGAPPSVATSVEPATPPTAQESSAAAASPVPATPIGTPSPRASIAPTGTQVEFATPLSDDPNLDADDDEDVEHRYRRLDNIIGSDAIPGLADRDTVEAELHSVRWREAKAESADGGR